MGPMMQLTSALSLLPNAGDNSCSGTGFKRMACSGLTLDLDRRCAMVGNTEVGLSPMEFALVQVLMQHRGMPMSKEAISAALPLKIDVRMIDVYVSRSCKKVAAAGLEDVILTIGGRGYMIGRSDDEVDGVRDDVWPAAAPELASV